MQKLAGKHTAEIFTTKALHVQVGKYGISEALASAPSGISIGRFGHGHAVKAESVFVNRFPVELC